MKKSTSHLHKFVEVCKTLNMKMGAGLCLDVSTRWSSTYKMLDACTPYRYAFHEYGDHDLNYKWEPSHADWNMYAKVQPILAEFAEITKVLAGAEAAASAWHRRLAHASPPRPPGSSWRWGRKRMPPAERLHLQRVDWARPPPARRAAPPCMVLARSRWERWRR
jgi:hypothetical protein